MKRTLLATLLFSSLYTAHAQTIHLQQAYEAARTYDASYIAAQSSLVAAQERAQQAKSGLLPAVNLGSTASRNSLDNTPGTDRSYSTAAVALSASYPLYRPANTETFNQAQASEKIAQANLASAKQDLITRVSQAYFDLLLAQDTLTSINAQKAAISEQLAQAKREFEVGTKTIVDTNEAQARFDQVLALQAVAQGDVQIKKAALDLITGLKYTGQASLGDKVKVPAPMPTDVTEWTNRANEAAIAVQTAGLALDIAKLEYAKTKSNTGPTVDLTSSVNVSRNFGSASTNSLYTSRLASIGIALNYPLYAGGALDSKVREAAANVEKAKADVDTARRSAAQAARQAYFGLTYGIAQISALESAERSSLTLLDSTKLGYQVGVRINLDVLNAQQALASTRKDLAKARYDALMAGIKLKAITSQLTEDDIAQVNKLLTGTPANL